MFASDHSLGISPVSIDCSRRGANIGLVLTQVLLKLWDAAHQVLKLFFFFFFFGGGGGGGRGGGGGVQSLRKFCCNCFV